MMGKVNRGRLTLPDVVFVLATLAFMTPLYLVLSDGLDENAAQIGDGTAYLIQLILPMAVLVMLALIWAKAVAG